MTVEVAPEGTMDLGIVTFTAPIAPSSVALKRMSVVPPLENRSVDIVTVAFVLNSILTCRPLVLTVAVEVIQGVLK